MVGEDLFVFDAGSGLVALSAAQLRDAEMRGVRRVHVLVTHAHLDHWEGLKDAEWLWAKGCGVELTILAPQEALDAMNNAFQPPSFVKLDILAIGTVERLSYVPLKARDSLDLHGTRLEILELYHYSGLAANKRFLDTYGYRLTVPGGPTVVYMCDHEPVPETKPMEDAALAGAHLAVVDASYCHCSQHAFGHGSVESAAGLARRFADTLVLAGHHGAMQEDEVIEEAMQRHGADLDNLSLATEDTAGLDWDAQAGRFVDR
jgi:phosphoribosyl 1,2-cyclic phosphodiesterase